MPEGKRSNNLVAVYGQDIWCIAQASLVRCRARLSAVLEGLHRMFVKVSSEMSGKSPVGYTKRILHSIGYDTYKKELDETHEASRQALSSYQSAAASFASYLDDGRPWQQEQLNWPKTRSPQPERLTYNWYPSRQAKLDMQANPGKYGDHTANVKLFNYYDAVEAVRRAAKFHATEILFTLCDGEKFRKDTKFPLIHHSPYGYSDVNKVRIRLSQYEYLRREADISGIAYTAEVDGTSRRLFHHINEKHVAQVRNTVDHARTLLMMFGEANEFVSPTYFKTINTNVDYNFDEEQYAAEMFAIRDETRQIKIGDVLDPDAQGIDRDLWNKIIKNQLSINKLLLISKYLRFAFKKEKPNGK